ncbi:sensor histidine kinase [Geotoga petraea]|uniref:histidine kinase n=1 Tax=Geotoga petraea TaxID=28234 RepID=A0A4Z0W6N5_9BACT|nr:HAMP domain-containing sensor histidine kinase [Geotoga petraea]TGG88764.1 HAMP domain-containing histidine kinase [Geotoga petraea]
MKSFADKVSKSLYFNYLIFSIVMVLIIFIATYGIIKQNVQNNLNILFKNKEDFINNYYLDMTDEFFSYMLGTNQEIENIDFVYNLDNLSFVKTPETQSSFSFSYEDLSKQIYMNDSNQLYLINWQYFDTKRYIYGVSLENLNKALNSEGQTGDFISVIKYNDRYIIPNSVVFKSKLENILSEYPSKISLENNSYEVLYGNIRSFDFFLLYNSTVLLQLRNTLIIIAAIFLVLGFLISRTNIQYIKSQISEPITSIVNGIKNVKNNRSKEIIYSEDDEFRLIKDEFNSLYKSLSKTIKELEISENNLKKNSEFKSNILKILSHEIRTPIHTIMGFSDILQMKIDSEEDKENLRTIKKSSEDILNKFDRLFERSKIESESDEIKLKLSKFNILDVIFEVSSKYESMCRKKGIKLKIYEENLEQIGDSLLDYKKVKRIFEEVIDNAYKFTDEGEITISVEDEGDEIEVSVRDTGIGVKTENMDLIYDSFFQTENYLSRKKDGLGIGLSIVKSYVTMLGGQVFLEPLDEGTLVKVSFPKGINKQKISNIDPLEDIKNAQKIIEQNDLKRVLNIISNTLENIVKSTSEDSVYSNMVELQSIFKSNNFVNSYEINTEILNSLKEKETREIIDYYKEFKNVYETVSYSL